MPTSLENAQELASWGFNVLPARGKKVAIKWAEWQHKRSDSDLSRWFQPRSQFNYWTLCGGISGWVCLDCDSDAGEAFWRNQLGDEVLDATTCVQTAKGKHYWFRIPDGTTIPTWSQNEAQREAGILYDIRGEGAGAILPPSIHETGHVYTWVRDPDHAVEAPEPLFGPRTTEDGDEAPQTRSLLTQLLTTPPAGEGGRNNWLARVAGHYAKQWAPHIRDAYDFHLDQAAAMLNPPLPDDEIEKLRESIWKKECAKGHDELVGVAPSEENGWLFSGGNCLLTECKTGKGADADTTLEPWGDFDIRARGVVEDEESKRVYNVEVARRRRGDVRKGMLPAAVLADARALNVWLGEFGVSILPPPGMTAKGSPNQRLARYIEAQDPPHFKAVPALGWHGDGFVCHEGVITADGLKPFTDHKPGTYTVNWAPYHYGFDHKPEAVRAILREALTFHDETVCSVFGAWWAACFLKPQIEAAGASQFPIMALQAPSESGKSTGFFRIMIALNGNTQGQNAPTAAALRDYISAHQSGIVWIDDLSDTGHLMDLLRQATGGGTVSKKGEDRHTQETIKLVSPIVVSGEALDLTGQKALMDRAVMLDVPSPTKRMSLHDPDQFQWDDIVRMNQRYPDLTSVSGTLVQMALQQMSIVQQLPELRLQSGRFGDKVATLRVGARLLSILTDDSIHTTRTDRWCDLQESVGNENTLTLRLIPEALRRHNFPNRPEASNGHWPNTPVFVAEGLVWFHCQALAEWWHEIARGRIEKRTESAEGLRQQAEALDCGGKGGRDRKWSDGSLRVKRFNLSADPKNKATYWSCDPEMSDLVLRRARGEEVALRQDIGGMSSAQQSLLPDRRNLRLPVYFRPEDVEAPDE